MAPIRILGPHIYSKNGKSKFEPQVATMFPDFRTLVTEGTTHFRHREVMCNWLDEQRRLAGEAPLDDRERSFVFWKAGVDLIILPEVIQIRPNPAELDRMLAGDAQLQELVNKVFIRFLFPTNPGVRDALMRQGELWRLACDPVTTDEIKNCVRAARMKLAGRPIYYYSTATGTRYLTLTEFRQLADLAADELCEHLVEIQQNCHRTNHRGGYEVGFFLRKSEACHHPELRDVFEAAHFLAIDAVALRAEHQRLCGIFEDFVHASLRIDDLASPDWLQEMHERLHPLQEHAADAAKFLGLAPEFHKHIKWLPGGRIKHGNLVFDSVYADANGELPVSFQSQEYRRSRAIILNFVRDYGDLAHINIGWINESLSRAGREPRGHRDVYVVAMKRVSEPHHQVHILRMQKWDMTHRLDDSASLEDAMCQTEEYTEYTQDRYLGCRRLGMNLFGPVRIGKISELYSGRQEDFHGATTIWTPYFERPYIDGIATNTIPRDRWDRPGYAEEFARLLGRAAAPNIIVGRGDGPMDAADKDLIVFFDDGDEIAVEEQMMIKGLIVAHHTGSFWHFKYALLRLAAAYARPVNARLLLVPDAVAFANAYLDALHDRFVQIQTDYRDNRGEFEQLFQLRHCRQAGGFYDRWCCVLTRLDATDPDELKAAIAKHIAWPEPHDQTSPLRNPSD